MFRQRPLGNSEFSGRRKRPFRACCISTSPNYDMSYLEEIEWEGLL